MVGVAIAIIIFLVLAVGTCLAIIISMNEADRERRLELGDVYGQLARLEIELENAEQRLEVSEHIRDVQGKRLTEALSKEDTHV